VTVVTVVRHDLPGLKKTAASLLSQTHSGFEWIIVDGGSDSPTASFCASLVVPPEASLHIVRELDRGIYDAMNKGILLAQGDWCLFMNAGDRFAAQDSLAKAMALAGEEVDVIYSDVIFERGDKQEWIRCDLGRRRFHHQAIVYRKSLHDEYGSYVVAPGVTISDYLFLNGLAQLPWVKCDFPIAVCDATGMSSKPRAYYQKLAIDLVLGLKPPMVVAAMIFLYPMYRVLVKSLVTPFQRWTKQPDMSSYSEPRLSTEQLAAVDEARSAIR